MTEPDLPLRRGDRRRRAILQAARELLVDNRFEKLSVSSITKQAGMTRSGFYFYFDSKHSVLAALLEECHTELQELTQHFSARAADESPEAFVQRMIASTAAVFSHNQTIMTASFAARNTDYEIRAVMDGLANSVIAQVERQIAYEAATGTAIPIGSDIPALARILSATTQLVLARDSTFIESTDGLPRALRILEELWLQAIWGCGR